MLLVPTFINGILNFIIIVGSPKSNEKIDICIFSTNIVTVTIDEHSHFFVHEIALCTSTFELHDIFLCRSFVARLQLIEFENQ